MPAATCPSPGRPRNVLDDPFAVRGNRETIGGELLIAYDPTPATWMWAWDNDVREDARLAASLGLVVPPPAHDAWTPSIGILADGDHARSPSSPPRGRTPRARPVGGDAAASCRAWAPTCASSAHAYVGTGEPNG